MGFISLFFPLYPLNKSLIFVKEKLGEAKNLNLTKIENLYTVYIPNRLKNY
jgi:hypothetical protein